MTFQCFEVVKLAFSLCTTAIVDKDGYMEQVGDFLLASASHVQIDGKLAFSAT